MAEGRDSRVIAVQGADESEATSVLPADHRGSCAMSCRGQLGQVWAIFPSLLEAERAAAFALRSDIGGYWEVEVHPKDAAPPDAPTYDDAWTWLGA